MRDQTDPDGLAPPTSFTDPLSSSSSVLSMQLGSFDGDLYSGELIFFHHLPTDLFFLMDTSSTPNLISERDFLEKFKGEELLPSPVNVTGIGGKASIKGLAWLPFSSPDENDPDPVKSSLLGRNRRTIECNRA